MIRSHSIFSFAATVAALSILPFACAQSPRVVDDIVVTADANVTPVRIEGDTPELTNLAIRAFNAHGAFSVSGSAATTIRFNVTGPGSVRVSVESGKPARPIFTQDVSGNSLRNALLRAADAAVTSITRRPGFFAGKLAFVSQRTGSSEVYTSDLFFGEVLQMTSDRAQCVTPRWAPDGRRILYTSYMQHGVPDIYLIDTGSRQRSVFVSVKGTNTGARFSPDGSQVAMVLSPTGNADVYVSNAQGRQIRALRKSADQIESSPSWAADGSRLIVASDAGATNKPQLYLLSLSGGGMQRVPTNVSGYCAEPDWSHVNRDLVAFTVASGRGYQIAVFSFSSRTSKVVTRVAGDGVEPSWTADGRHIVFTRRTSRSQTICIVDSETGKTTELSPSALGRAYQANYVAR